MTNLLVMMDIDTMWKLWVFVSITSVVVIDACRIAYDCVKGDFATNRLKYRADMAYLDRWNWTPTAEQKTKLDAEVSESKRLIAAYREKQRKIMLAAVSK